MKYSLKQRLTMSYIIIVIVSIGFASLFANFGIRNQFKRYAIQKQEKETEETVNLIKMKYEEEGGWSSSYLDLIGMNALQNGMTVVITDREDKTVWSAYEHNSGLCHAMMENMVINMSSYSNKWDGKYEEKTYSIKGKAGVIGTLTTGFMGPYYFNSEELIFIKALNSILIMTGAASIILAFLLGIFMSARISSPLTKISDKAISLARGEYKNRITDDISTKEIKVLADTINQLSDALLDKDRLRKQLTQDVAHELRTPLTSVQGHMEAMLDGIWELSEERLLSCYDEIIRIKRLIGSIEDLSVAEDRNIILYREEFIFLTLVGRILQNFERELLDKGMKVNLKGILEKRTEETLYADKDKISQVLNNLLSNAIKYSDIGAEITLSFLKEDKEAIIIVADTGTGISEEDLPHIFKRFFRADKSRNSNTGGAGIGLAITQAIIKAHGGSITVNSVYGKGTEFTITLPQD